MKDMKKIWWLITIIIDELTCQECNNIENVPVVFELFTDYNNIYDKLLSEKVEFVNYHTRPDSILKDKYNLYSEELISVCIVGLKSDGSTIRHKEAERQVKEICKKKATKALRLEEV